MSFKNFIFDFDGTIAHTAPEVLKCIERAFAEAGCPLDNSEVKDTLIGPPLAEIVNGLRPNITESCQQEIIRNFRRLYDYESSGLTKLYPFIYEALEAIHSRGCLLFIATNKPVIPLRRLMQELKIEIFDDLYTADRNGKRMTKKEMLQCLISEHSLIKAETVMIGDALSDINAGLHNGIASAAAMWGYADSEEKKQMSAAAGHILESGKDIISLL